MAFSWLGRWMRIHRLYAIEPAEGHGTASLSDDPRRGDSAAEPGVIDQLTAALASASAGASHFLDLVSLEARRAGHALMNMMMCALVAALCIMAAWLGVMAAVALWLVSLGMPTIPAVLIIAFVNLIVAAMLVSTFTGMSHDLLFPATRRQIAGKSPIKPESQS